MAPSYDHLEAVTDEEDIDNVDKYDRNGITGNYG